MSENEVANLPALIDRACSRLASARTSAEVLEAKAIAEMALHYARITKAANETHADCLRMIVRAEMRMADEIDAGQERGEIARVGNPHDSNSPTLGELNIPSQRVSEWRETRDAGQEVVEQAIQGALAEGRPPTKSDIAAHVRGTFGTGENEWYTPDLHLQAVRDVLGVIDLDPASSAIAQNRVKATAFFSKDDDGLARDWRGRIFLNPPYAQPHIASFVSKMVSEFRAGRVSAAIMLTHNYTDTAWFHEAAGSSSAICFTRGRVKFVDAAGNVAAPTQGQAFFYFGDNVEGFSARFRDIGFVVAPA